MGDVINVDFSGKSPNTPEELDAVLSRRFKEVLTDAGFHETIASGVSEFVGNETAKRVAGLDQLCAFTVSFKLDLTSATSPQDLTEQINQIWAAELKQRITDLRKYAEQSIVLAAFDALTMLAKSDQSSGR